MFGRLAMGFANVRAGARVLKRVPGAIDGGHAKRDDGVEHRACTSTSISTRVPARTLANPIARRPNISESHSETRVLEYPFSTPFRHTKGYVRVLGGGRAWVADCSRRGTRPAQASRCCSHTRSLRMSVPCSGATWLVSASNTQTLSLIGAVTR